MNTNAVARHYDTLAPRERYPLLVAARTRGDEAEAERLARSAPRGLFRVPDYCGLAETMSDLALLHLLQQLDTAAWLWRIDGLLESNLSFGRNGRTDEGTDQRLLTVLRLRAYLFVIEGEGWQRFSEELHLDPEALLRDLPGYDTVKQAEPLARAVAFTPEEAVAAFHSRWGDRAAVQTVDQVVAEFRAGLASRQEWWT